MCTILIPKRNIETVCAIMNESACYENGSSTLSS